MADPATLQEMTARHAGVLAEFTAILLDAARQCGVDVAQAASADEKKEAYARLPSLARAARQCMVLEGRIVRDGLKDRQAADRIACAAADEAAEAERQALRAERYARKALVDQRVAHVIEQSAADEDDEDELARLHEDLRTRLDDETFEAEFAHLPYEAVIRTLHRDLKLPAPVFTGQDQVRARLWAAQWDHPPPEPPPAPEPDPPPEPAPDPEPYFRYSSS